MVRPASSSAAAASWALVPVGAPYFAYDGRARPPIAIPSDGGEVVLGRGEACDVRFAEGFVSRTHATLEVNGGKCFLTPASSDAKLINVNAAGTKRGAPVELFAGDAVNFVKDEPSFAYRVERSADPAAAEPSVMEWAFGEAAAPAAAPAAAEPSVLEWAFGEAAAPAAAPPPSSGTKRRRRALADEYECAICSGARLPRGNGNRRGRPPRSSGNDEAFEGRAVPGIPLGGRFRFDGGL